MELTQQIKNFQATLAHSKKAAPTFKVEDHSSDSHSRALQGLANGHDVPYQATLRVVGHEGCRGPRLPPRQTNKAAGYIRNESGGTFTS